MKYLITGTSGFIGSHLVQRLASNPENYIYCLDKDPLNIVMPHLMSLDNVEEIIHNLRFPVPLLPDVDYVIHLAAFNGTKHFYSKAYDVIKDNILTTINLIDCYRNRDIKRFIYSGTPESTVVSTEYFDYGLPTDENAPVGVIDVKNKRWSYANSKALGEQAVIASDLPYTIIRYNNVYGPRQIDHFISEFYDRVVSKEYSLYGHENTRTFIYINDAIDATELLINNQGAINDIFNIGGEKETTILEVAKTILKLMNKEDVELELHPAPIGSTMRRWPDISKLKNLTGFEQKVSLEEGLIKTLKLEGYETMRVLDELDKQGDNV